MAKRFFREALPLFHTVNPYTITVDKNPAYPRAAADMKRSGELWRFSRLRPCRYLNNIAERDHCQTKRLVGLASVRQSGDRTAGNSWLRGMAMIRKGQVHNVGSRDMRAKAAFAADLF